MKTNVVATINQISIVASEQSEGLIPIRPICEALGVSFTKQNSKLKSHPIYGSVVTLRVTTGADGKQYEMICIPIEFLPGWLFSIHPDNVKEESRENIIAYQIECNKALFNYFFGSQKRQLENNRIEIALLEEIGELTQQKTVVTSELNEKKQALNKLRTDRLRNEPSLFDSIQQQEGGEL